MVGISRRSLLVSGLTGSERIRQVANTEFIQKWVDALRSGEYKQCTQQLGMDTPEGTSYCCLGVATELAIKDGVPIRRESVDNFNTIVYTSNDLIETLMPPKSVKEHAGVDNWVVSVPAERLLGYEEHEDGEIIDVEVSELNDDQGWSFSEIADVLEAEFLGGK
jgi:hypothetical protein